MQFSAYYEIAHFVCGNNMHLLGKTWGKIF